MFNVTFVGLNKGIALEHLDGPQLTTNSLTKVDGNSLTKDRFNGYLLTKDIL